MLVALILWLSPPQDAGKTHAASPSLQSDLYPSCTQAPLTPALTGLDEPGSDYHIYLPLIFKAPDPPPLPPCTVYCGLATTYEVAHTTASGKWAPRVDWLPAGGNFRIALRVRFAVEQLGEHRISIYADGHRSSYAGPLFYVGTDYNDQVDYINGTVQVYVDGQPGGWWPESDCSLNWYLKGENATSPDVFFFGNPALARHAPGSWSQVSLDWVVTFVGLPRTLPL